MLRPYHMGGLKRQGARGNPGRLSFSGPNPGGGAPNGSLGLRVVRLATEWGGRGGVGVGVAGVGLAPLFFKDIWQLFLRGYADYQSARPARPPRHGSESEGARAARQ